MKEVKMSSKVVIYNDKITKPNGKCYKDITYYEKHLYT